VSVALQLDSCTAAVRRRAMKRIQLLHALIPLAIAASTTLAQSTLRGVVQRHADTTRVTAASVALVPYGSSDSTGRTRTTDSTGTFIFSDLAGGRYELRVRRLGFAPYVDTLDIVSNETMYQVVQLAELPEQLPTVLIRGEMVEVPKGFEDVYRRGARSFGYFMTAEQISTRNPMQTRDLLIGLPGILIEGNQIVFPRCIQRSRDRFGATAGGSPQVYIDGQRVTRFGDVDVALSYVEPRSIQAIEVYTGLSQIPGDFATQACAAVAIWTKRE
jgi:hypothetical protein